MQETNWYLAHLLSTSLSVNIFLGLRFMISLSGRSYEKEIAGN